MNRNQGGLGKSMCARKVVTCGPVLGLPSPSRRDGAAPRGTWRIWKFPAVDSGVREWGGKLGRSGGWDKGGGGRLWRRRKMPGRWFDIVILLCWLSHVVL
ncbi:hypothetical protein CI102_11194 [Trichoderma harzianum]|uniref:Uncharacterized protein n=1 Tax=Trichoderma harzianum CBS 226.95 TaxID=983964 RepID=A0A2T4AFL3_TRIHA|nr:hypothetical protein M431DRAFT_410536 [Trichoderma harzianum CBS 226.95]PKK44635.1 hypothetical protein CI102_11194 [Trichoderma harzianum]PTB55857.1 hypothetical protein M431DRAFT_410536 [Trichoderma harzianum CBS 226.95]